MKTLTLAVGLLALFTGNSVAQYDGTGDCEQFANAFYKTRDADFRGFVIDRKTVEESAFEEDVGFQHVTAIFRGRATYVDRRSRRAGTFICLHAGPAKGAVFVYLFTR